MAVTRINNNQITDASTGNVYVGINAGTKLQDYSITAGKIANSLTYGSDLTITGNLTVNGQTTTIDTVSTVIEDPVIVLASNQTGTPSVDIGFIGERGDQNNIAFVWDESADEFVTAFTTDLVTNTTITIASYANFHTNDANVGGNLAVGGNVTFTGNVTSLNVTGNITGGNLLTPGVVTATGNLSGGNVTTAGQVVATGNVSGGNVVSSALVSGTTVTASGNVSGGNVTTVGQVAATGNVSGGNLISAGDVTTSTVTASSNVSGGNLTTAGQVVATGNVTGGNLSAGSGIISTTGNINGGNVNATAGITAGTTVTATGNVSGGNVTTAGQVIATGNITGGNLITTGTFESATISATGNITGGNLITAGLTSTGSLTASTTIAATGNVSGGNLTTVGITSTGSLTASTTISATGNVSGGNVTTGGNVVATGNVTGGNVTTAGQVVATGNVSGGNLITAGLTQTNTLNVTAGANVGTTLGVTGNITGGNVSAGSGIVSTTGNINGGNVNATSGVTAATVTASGNISGGNISTAGDVRAATLETTGNALIGGNLIVQGNISYINIDDLRVEDPIIILGTGPNGAPLVADDGLDRGIFMEYYTTGLGNAFMGWDNSSGNMVIANDVEFTANDVVGVNSYGTLQAGNLYIQSAVSTGNITGGNLGTAGQVVATGNITGGNLITSGSMSVTGNIGAGNLNAVNAVTASTGYFTGNVDVLGNLNATIGVVYANSGIFLGDAVTGNNAAFAGIPGFTQLGSNVVMQFAGNVNSYSQLNFQNINNGTSASTDFIATADNGSDTTYYLDLGINSSTFNDPTNYPGFGPNDAYVHNHGGNLILNPESAGKAINFMIGGTANANVIGYINTSGLSITGTIGATSNVSGGNLTTAGQVAATGNVSGGNLTTAGLISAGTTITATGNLIGGNVNTAGTVNATGNINGTGAVFSGNVTAANFIGNISGNIDAGGANTNIQFNDNEVLAGSAAFTFDKTSNAVIASGNITGGNIGTGGQFISTGTGSSTTGSGQLYLNGAGNNRIDYNTNGTGAPALTTRSAGTKLTLFPALSGSTVDYAIGIDSATMWHSVPENTSGFYFKWYGATTEVANISGTGVFSAVGNVNGGNITTAGQVVATGNVTGANLILTTGIINGPAAGRITINGSDADVDFAVDGDTVANVFYVDAGTGTASFGSATQTTNAVVAFNATNSVLMPVGNVAQRPGTGVTGMLRFNTTADALEVYDNAQWTTVGVPSFTVIADEQFNGDGSTVAFVLGSEQTTASCIVSINGVVQIPTIAYSVSGTGTSTLTFTEAPEPGDIIDVREITTTTTVTSISNLSGNAAIGVSDTSNDISITGDLIPVGNATQSLGSPTNYWSSLYVAGNTIHLGNLQLKAENGTMAFYESDGTTPAPVAASSVDTTTIASGTSSVSVIASGGNIRSNVGGTTVQTISTGLVAITGDLSVSGNATLSGNILGDRVQNGTTSFDIQTPSGNANITVGATSNVAVFTTTGLTLGTGVLTVGSIVNANANGVGNIGSSTTYFNTVFAKATSAQYADLAEKYVADADYPAGTVVVFGGDKEVTVSSVDADRAVAGVVSTNPSYIMNGGLEAEYVATVALTGRVPCRVTGTVRKGDLMVSAGYGLARAEQDPRVGTVIGKALENHEGVQGVIEVVVGRF